MNAFRRPSVLVFLLTGGCWNLSVPGVGATDTDSDTADTDTDTDAGTEASTGGSSTEDGESSSDGESSGGPVEETGSVEESATEPDPSTTGVEEGEESSGGDPEPACGDGVVQAGEECDDGNDAENDDCLPSCLAASCGDGVVWDGVEQCDDDNVVPSSCPSNCLLPEAGDAGVDTSGAQWVVCGADGATAIISADGTGTYHAWQICESLGYASVYAMGWCTGPFGPSDCAPPTTCEQWGQLPGFVEDCGVDPSEPTLCGSVMWQCS